MTKGRVEGRWRVVGVGALLLEEGRGCNNQHQQSPALDKEAVVLKGLADQNFGEVIGALVAGVDFDEFKLIGMVPKPVPLVEEVAGTVGDAVIGREEVGTLVILKDSSTHGSADGRRNVQDIDCFQ